MRATTRRLHVAGALGLVLAFSGCAGTAPFAAHESTQWVSDGGLRGKKLVYVADDNGVEIYPAGLDDPPRIGRITDGIAGADGLFVDPKGNLYVANLRGASVTVYRPGKTSPFEKYVTTKNPTDVVVGRDGTVYISQSSGGCICITEYAPGSTVPKLTIPLKTIGGYPLFMALDASNNLYVSIASVGGGIVLKVRSGRTKGSPLSLPGLVTPRGLGFTNRGALAVANDTLDFQYGFVDVYRRSKAEYKVLQQFDAGAQPEQITFDREYRRLYVADATYMRHGGAVAIFEAGGGWKQVGGILHGLNQPSGVALSPGAF